MLAPMFLPGFRDLVRSPWVTILEELKMRGGCSIPVLAEVMEMSYMGVKKHCEDLLSIGYLQRSRVPRTEVGRPEVMYRLSPKAEAFFPQAGTHFSLALLTQIKELFGNNAPEKLLFQYFSDLQEQWQGRMHRAKSLVEKATLLVSLREKEGCLTRCTYDAKLGFRIEEFHHPMAPIFEAYPVATSFETRMIENLMGTKIERREVSGSRHGPARIEYLIHTL
jgi:predicted ArsR family transcriptional regulator